MELAYQINWETDSIAYACHFWDRHAAVLVDDHVIDPTARQYDKNIRDLFYLDKSEYTYWLAGSLFSRGVVVINGPWERLEESGNIKKLCQ